jgi:hypothetical protein
VTMCGRVWSGSAVTDLVATATDRVWHVDVRASAALAEWRTGTGRVSNVGGGAEPSAYLVGPSVTEAYPLLLGGRTLTEVTT